MYSLIPGNQRGSDILFTCEKRFTRVDRIQSKHPHPKVARNFPLELISQLEATDRCYRCQWIRDLAVLKEGLSQGTYHGFGLDC